MRRLVTASIISTLLVSSLSGLASAGGSWLEVRRVDGTGGVSNGAWGGWASAGSSVFMQGDFCDGQQADPSAGPWTAYLRRDPTGARQPLGPVEISSATGRGCPFSASVTFVVPDVESGMYWVDVCADASCTTGVGDLIGAMLAVASTRLEASALTVLPNLKARLQQGRQMRHRLHRRLDSLREAVRMTSEDLDSSNLEAVDAKDGLETAMAARDTSATEIDAARRAESIWRSVAIVTLLAFAAAVACLMTTVIRGRRRSVHVPDTPGELLTPAVRH
jgi:hypothetical protein